MFYYFCNQYCFGHDFRHSENVCTENIFEVRFVPLDIEDDESISDLLSLIDSTIQHGEDLEVSFIYIRQTVIQCQVKLLRRRIICMHMRIYLSVYMFLCNRKCCELSVS